MATKKIASKKAPVKVAAKKVAAKPLAKPAVKKVVAKSAKPLAKKPASKPVAKPTKKVAAPAKSVAKKAVAKSAKPAAKKPVSKAVAKPTKKVAAPAKPVAKKAVAKSAKSAKPIAKSAKPIAKPAKPVVKVVAKSVKKVAVPAKSKKIVAPAKPVAKKIETKAIKPIDEKVKLMPDKKEKVEKVVAPEKPAKAEKPPKPPKPEKVKKTKVKKPKRIIRQSKPAKPIKAAGIEKATFVIPVKKIVPKVKEEPIKNFKVPKITTKSSVAYNPDYVPMDRRKEDAEPNAPTVRYSDAELNEFRDLITKKLDAAKRELAYLQGVITRKDDMGGGAQDEGRYMTLEDGSMSMEREQMSNMASRQVTFIDHLEKAIQRIESKTYGVCRVTGRLIDKARLRAVPHATLSLEAKLGLVKAGE
jgi:RNA polymerase-binding transcription factor DksA